MAAPETYPRNPDLSYTDYRWKTGAPAPTEPTSGRKDSGISPGDIGNPVEINWLHKTGGEFGRSALAEHLRTTSAFGSSWLDPGDMFPAPVGLGTWSDTGVGPLEGFLSDATGVATRVVDIWLDPLGNGATGLQVRVSSATPALFVASSDNYVFVDLTEAIAQVGAGVTILSVPNGNPQPLPPAGSVLVWVVITDAASITGQSISIPTVPALKFVGFEGIGTSGDVFIDGDLDVEGATMLNGAVDLGDAVGDVITVKGTTTFNEVANFDKTVTIDTTAAGNLPGLVTIVTDERGHNVSSNSATLPTSTLANAAAGGASVETGVGAVATDTVHTVENTGEGRAGLYTNSSVLAAALEIVNNGGGGAVGLLVQQVTTLNGILNTLAGVNLAGQTIQGTAGSLVDVERGAVTDLELNDAGVLLPASARRIRYNETSPTIHGSDGVVRSLPVPDYGFQASFSTPNAIDTTGAVCARRLREPETVRITITFDFEHTGGASGTLNTRIEVAGPITIDINSLTHLLPASPGARWRSKTLVFHWTPTDDFVLPGTFGYSFTVRAGSTLGATLNLRNIGIKVVPVIRV